ncbi:unnamed protein product [Prorocentrum cordatum]|uniref:Sugar phosphate transporter domain-containing protein n=1 Tax=Prorocentrum cordatum TaxID=2364126 RepID=A0ABN9UY45_9DINO|nr:unnamed protein product [Polarella glacialis]
MACTGVLASGRCTGLRKLPLHSSACIAVIVVVSQSLNRTGNVLAGSAMCAVIYSSSTIWNALLSRMILKRVLTLWQWCGIVVVVLGLAIASIEAKGQGERIFLGAAMITVGALLHSLGHVLSEFVSVRGSRIPPYVNSCVQGIVCFAVASTWQCTYTASHWEKIAVPMDEARTSWGHAFLLLGGLAVGNFVHAATFFYLLTSIGAVSTGLLKSLQAVAVFCLSHLLYCGRDPSQCFTPVKGTSLLVVVCGMLCYVAATGASQIRPHASSRGSQA